MSRTGQRWAGWRRLTACLLVCTLFLHGMAYAMAGVRLAADPAGGVDWAGFELCRHDNSAPGQPGAPEGQVGDTHCVFCVAGPGFVLTPPAVSTVFFPVEISIAPWPMAAWRVAPTTVGASARPRGPPPAA
ncbi:MAG TPA: hypothetical protein VGP86_15905 [Xanthobacteraceae bacterium]|jgi:hypothetical protein|nr:hypothetical protein [Xanthobacteraceae bacterium]